MRVICSVHGVVSPKSIMYSCPAQANCPHCGAIMEDSEGGINIIIGEREAVLKRPELYRKTHPDIYEKYVNGIVKHE